MRRADVLSAGIGYGELLTGHDVARVTRSGCVRLRHAWPQGTDARAWDAIRRAALRLAREVSAQRGRTVEVQDSHGSTLTYWEET